MSQRTIRLQQSTMPHVPIAFKPFLHANLVDPFFVTHFYRTPSRKFDTFWKVFLLKLAMLCVFDPSARQLRTVLGRLVIGRLVIGRLVIRTIGHTDDWS